MTHELDSRNGAFKREANGPWREMGGDDAKLAMDAGYHFAHFAVRVLGSMAEWLENAAEGRPADMMGADVERLTFRVRGLGPSGNVLIEVMREDGRAWAVALQVPGYKPRHDAGVERDVLDGVTLACEGLHHPVAAEVCGHLYEAVMQYDLRLVPSEQAQDEHA